MTAQTQKKHNRWSQNIHNAAEVLVFVILAPAIVYGVLSINNVPIA